MIFFHLLTPKNKFLVGILLQNKVSRNERVDPGVVISRLKKEISDLKAELAMTKGGE